MTALKDNNTPWRCEQVANPTHPAASSLVSTWARGRRRITPWAFPHLRALGAVRLIVSIFLAGLGALFLSHGDYGWAAIPLAGAALTFSIGYLDFTAARSARPHA